MEAILFPRKRVEVENDGIAYLTGCSSELTRSANRADLGVLVTPASSIHRQIGHYPYFGADNGLFVESKRGNAFDPDKWLAWLDKLPRTGCRFAALPDVLNWVTLEDGKRIPVGDFEATLARSAGYVDTVRALGFPPALVAQDGLTELAQIPFDVDGIFVGGSDDYKLGEDAAALCREARAAGLYVHVGRVNSYKRLRHAAVEMDAHSADGTFVGYKPSENFGRMVAWLDKVNAADASERAA